MPVLNRIADLAPQMKEWRHWMHRHPELSFDLPETAAYVAARLREIGVDEIHEGIAGTGIVALVKGKAGRGSGKDLVVGLRADMDALPLTEETGLAYASETEGRMHACGHDGHTSMLLGAAAYLAETRNFPGTVALVFQPAEEDGGGGEKMVQEGVLDRFGISRIFALHNAPGLPFGQISTGPGPIMAAVDTFFVHVTGKGGHAAIPHETRDPIPPLAAIASAVPSIVSRNSYVQDELVISITQIHAGSAENIVPETGWLCGTVRTFDTEVQAMVRKRLSEIVSGTAIAFGVEAELDYQVGYPATVNHPGETRFAVEVAREVAGEAMVDPALDRQMGAEDFGYFLDACPGCYLFLGQGPGAALHHPAYDFNDEVAPVGATLLARLAERALAG